MKTSTKAAIITFAFAVPAFMTGRLIWPPAEGGTPPTPAQLPHLMVFSAVEAIALGLGVAFLVLAWPLVKRAPQEAKRRTVAAYAAIGWSLVSWWPHDNMHASNGENFGGLIKIEYLFHVTLVLSAILIANWFVKALPKGAQVTPPVPKA